jgi:hypothetical protein
VDFKLLEGDKHATDMAKLTSFLKLLVAKRPKIPFNIFILFLFVVL